MKKVCMTAIVAIAMSATAFAGLNTSTYVSIDGGGAGAVEGDMSGVGAVTLLDNTVTGDMWNDGDQFIYLHDSAKATSDFTATVRVVAQTEAIDGRWGKAGIRANASLDGNSSSAMTQLAAGNGSQPGQVDQVPVRLAGRATNGTNGGGYENPVLDAGGVEVPNDVFRSDGGVNTSWLSLSYTASNNAFVSGIAPDVNGAPGAWSYSAPKTDVQATGSGWYVGLAYSAHSDIAETTTRADGFHGVTFDNYSIVVPEPASVSMLLMALAGLAGIRHRK